MNTLKTPGVYIIEKNAFPNSVVEVATAVPAFIGYTEKAKNGSKSLINLPFRISFLAEYEQYFGKAPRKDFRLVKTDVNSLGLSALKDPGKFDAVKNCTEAIFKLSEPDDMQYYGLTRNYQFNLYYQLHFFFANGGGPCYIVSVNEGYKQDSFSYDALVGGIEPLLKEQEPTMVVIPEAVYLEEQECYDLQTAMLRHCATMGNRIAILDIYNGDQSRKDPEAGDVITTFREKIGTEFLNYAAAYYPWLNTAIISEKNLGIHSVSNIEDLQNILKSEAVFQKDEKRTQQLLNLAGRITKEGPESPSEKEEIHKILLQQSVAYATIMKKIAHDINLLPPSSAMAGIYTLVDSMRGVWKAPANIGLSSVISPSVTISHADQEDLNLPPDGKAINAIRYFTGEGIKVWGARTLDGNSLDWRYINVRRTVIMLEESIKYATRSFVFEPNTANTWVTVRSMVGNFLNGIWKRGGLAGAVPEDAFTVSVGLGETMTPEDILEGIMRITVLVAIVRPAEFIEITFQQQMQKS
ncbi:phage tail sheath C-terminal domain-containing protein [Chryseobacterium sp. MDT2-18]|uniref:phage tail sheath family protein n=1 Tax=Chryseobacterium sp. MDT2-18 TaxID=1259136 RepID=UPI0027887965|nr:phage tail sheath C-terminal domain-containing protein [Chryseobacterium sp. MDT2-18]MDQ0477109.1 phage tail sheath protein FI [Chryseobacterium sp. MDT2-18]